MYEEPFLCPLTGEKKEKLVEELPENNGEIESKLAAELNLGFGCVFTFSARDFF